MQLWLSRGNAIPIREQLATQIVLGILGGDLRAGQRLPSTRELARRFHIHPNTVSACYRKLQDDGWVDSRTGSGVFVRRNKSARLSADLELDRHIAKLFRTARELGISLATLRTRLRDHRNLQPPDRFLVIEPDSSLREIVVREIQLAVKFPVQGCGFEELHRPELLEGATAVVLPSKVEPVRQLLPTGTEVISLLVRSIPSSLAEYLPAPSAALIGIASGWTNFLTLAHTMLIAAGFSEDSLVIRDTHQPSWKKDLARTSGIVCDSVTAGQLSGKPQVVCFSLLSESCLEELKRYREFIGSAAIRLAPVAKSSRAKKAVE